jgi:hypothetical protein
VKQAPKQRAAGSRAWLRRVRTGAITRVKRTYTGLKNRYGPRYAGAMLSAAFLAMFLPLPGSSLLAVALVILAGEAHRLIAGRGGLVDALGGLAFLVKATVSRWASGPLPPRGALPPATHSLGFFRGAGIRSRSSVPSEQFAAVD